MASYGIFKQSSLRVVATPTDAMSIADGQIFSDTELFVAGVQLRSRPRSRPQALSNWNLPSTEKLVYTDAEENGITHKDLYVDELTTMSGCFSARHLLFVSLGRWSSTSYGRHFCRTVVALHRRF